MRCISLLYRTVLTYTNGEKVFLIFLEVALRQSVINITILEYYSFEENNIKRSLAIDDIDVDQYEDFNDLFTMITFSCQINGRSY